LTNLLPYHHPDEGGDDGARGKGAQFHRQKPVVT